MNSHENGHRENSHAEKEDSSPFLKTWNGIYIAIALYTCALILGSYLITIVLNR